MRRLIAVTLLVLIQHAAANAESVFVQVRSTQIRKQPVYWAPGVTSVSYGQELIVKGAETDGWFKVSTKAKVEGFLPVSAVSSSDARKSSSWFSTDSARDGSVSRESTVIAGKGLNAEVEREMGRKDSHMNFAAVDRLDRFVVSGSQIAAFAREGALGPSNKSK